MPESRWARAKQAARSSSSSRTSRGSAELRERAGAAARRGGGDGPPARWQIEAGRGDASDAAAAYEGGQPRGGAAAAAAAARKGPQETPQYGRDADPSTFRHGGSALPKDYRRLRPFQLKLICKSSGLPDTGSREALIKRLEMRDRGAMFTPDVGRVREPAAFTPATGRLRLAGNFAEEVGPEHSATRRRFERSFKEDLAAKLRVSEGRIKILALSEGSIVVKFEIGPPEAGQRDEPTAVEALDELKVQVDQEALGPLAGAPVTDFKMVQTTMVGRRRQISGKNVVIKFEILPGREGETSPEDVEQTLRTKLVKGALGPLADKEVAGFAGVPLDHPLLDAEFAPHVAAARSRAAYDNNTKRRRRQESLPLRQRLGLNGDLLTTHDLVSLKAADHQLIREALMQRSENNTWDTYLCYPETLVSLNPGLSHPDDETLAARYATAYSGILRPHAFGLASAAYRQLLISGDDRAIVCSGETGSGKTVAARRVAQFLAEGVPTAGKIERRLVQAMQVLDAFGNAVTTLNPDASRYGKYAKIWFDTRTGLSAAAAITTVQIERRRVALRSRDERSFHIFYQMCAGAGRDDAREFLLLPDAKDYLYLSSNARIDADRIADAEWWEKTRSSMTGAGLAPDEQRWVLRMVSTVMAVGNIDFNPGVDYVSFVNAHRAEVVANLLGVDPADLFTKLAKRTVRARGESSEVANSVQEARLTRDVLAGLLYQQLFQWLTERLNRGLRPLDPESVNMDRCNSLGVLDLYGFEKLPMNGFDQLCINYADEKVHHLSVSHFARAEEESYAEQGIDFFMDLRPFHGLDCLSVLEDPSESVSAILDGICSRAEGPSADKDFQEALMEAEFMQAHNRVARLERADFAIKHYAASVGYDVEGFTAQNRNTQELDLVPLCVSSQHKFVTGLFGELHKSIQSGQPRQTVLVKHRDNLGRIFKDLESVRLQYIRCFRPNVTFMSHFDEDYVQRQVLSAALPAMIQLRQDLYAHRLTFIEVASRYNVLVPEQYRAPPHLGPWAACKPILGQIEEDDACRYQIGKSHVFMTAGLYTHLEQQMIDIISEAAIKVQTKVRMIQARQIYRRRQAKRFEDMMNEHMANDNLREIQEAIRKLEAVPEMHDNMIDLQDRMDTILAEMVREVSSLSNMGERMIEYLRANKRVGPPEKRSLAVAGGDGSFEAPPDGARPFVKLVAAKFDKMDAIVDDLLYGDDDDDQSAAKVALSGVNFQAPAKRQQWAPKVPMKAPMPPPPKDVSIDDLCSFATRMKSCYSRYEKNSSFASGEISRLRACRGELIRQIKLYIRNFRDSEDPEAFLRRIDDFGPLEGELPELEALKTALTELVTRDREHMKSMVRSTDPQEVYDVLVRSKGIPGLQSEYDLLVAHFEGLRRIQMDELAGLLHEPHPGRIYADFRKFDIFGDECKILCAQVKAHRSSLIKAAQHRMQDLMISGGGPSAVREILEMYQDYPEDLDASRESVISYLDNLITSLIKRSDQLIHGESIEDIDDFLVRTPETDFGDALRHKLEALRNRKKELIQALQLEMKSAARSTDIVKVSKALDESERYLAYVGGERKELQTRFSMLVKEVQAQVQSLLQGTDYAAVLRMLEISDAFPSELDTSIAALKLFRESLLEQTKRRVRDVLASEILPEIIRERIEIQSFGDDMVEESIALQQKSSTLISQARTIIMALMQNREATVRVLMQAMETYANYPADLETERDGLGRKLDSLVDQAERRLADLLHSNDAAAIDRAITELDGTDDRLAPSLKTLNRHRKELMRNCSLRMHSLLHSEDPIAIRAEVQASLPFGTDLKSERNSLEAHCSAVLDRANREMEELRSSNNYEEVVDALKKYEQFPEESRLSFADLEQRRDLLLANARTAIQDMSLNHPNDLQMAADSMIKYEGYPQHIRAMVAQWFQTLIGKAQVDILALVQSDVFPSVDRALERYTKIAADELTQDLGNLSRHRDNLLQKTKKRLQTLALTCEDPTEITQELEKHEDYGAHITEEVKLLHDRWLKLTQLAQDELSRLVQSPESTLLELERAIQQYKNYPPEVQLIYNALKKKYDVFVHQAEDRLTRLLTSFNVRNIDRALAELRNSCEALAPLIAKLDGHRLEAVLAMSTKMQAAARGSDALIIAQILDESKDYGKELVLERDSLQERFEWLLGDAKTELTEMLKSNNVPAIIQTLEKYEKYPSSIDHLRDKLTRHKDALVSETRLRLSELCVGDDPTEIVLQLSLTDGYAEYLHDERSAAQTRLADLIRQARAQMRNVLQDTNATLKEVEVCLSAYVSYPEDVNQVRASLMSKRDALADSAADELAQLQGSGDIGLINQGLEKYLGSSDLIKSAVTIVERRRAELCRVLAKEMRAAGSSEDLVLMNDLLVKADQYASEEVTREKKALTLRYQTVADLVVAEIRELQRSREFERVALACEKYKNYPEVVRPRWQELMGHRKELLEMARRELEKARRGSHPKKISEALASVEKYGQAIAPERVALQARWAELVHNAHKDMLALVQNKEATVELIELKLTQYEEFPRDVDEVRRKLQAKCDNLQQIRTELTALAHTDDPNEILAALQEFVQYGAAVASETDGLQSQFRLLMRNARTEMRTCVQNPEATISDMQRILAKYSSYPDDVDTVREALQRNLDKAKSAAQDKLMKLLRSNNIEEIDAALQQYAGANRSLDGAVDELENHREQLCLTLAAKMEDTLASADLKGIAAVLVESEPFGSDLQQLREAVTRHYNVTLEKTCARLLSLCQSDDYVLIDQTLSQHAEHVPDVRPDWEKLQAHRNKLAEDARAKLRGLFRCEQPSEIDAALDSCEGFADEVAAEVAELHTRRQALIDHARATMRELLANPDASITEVSAHLHTYRFYPVEGEGDLHALRDELQQKHEALLVKVQAELAELQKSDDLAHIDAAMKAIQDPHPVVTTALRDLERHRTELVRSMSVKVQTATGYADPAMMMAVLEESRPYEEDVHAERGALKARFDEVIREAKQTLVDALHSSDYNVVSATLVKYEDFPGEIKERWQALRAHQNSLRQETMAHVQRALSSRDSKEIDALIARLDRDAMQQQQQQQQPGADGDGGGAGSDDLGKYREMLLQRRAKLLDSARQSIRQALSSTDLSTIDRTFEENAHLVSEFPKEYFAALRRHREEVLEGMRARVRAALDGFNLMQIDQELQATKGFEDEMFEEIADLQEHRAYVLEEAGAVKASAREVLISTDFATVDAKLSQMESFGKHAVAETQALRAHKQWLVERAKQDMRNAASLTNPQQIARTLVKYEYMGEAIADEAASLSTCVSQLLEQQRARLVDACQSTAPPAILVLLEETEYFSVELVEERARLTRHRNELIEVARAELGRQLCGSDIEGISHALAKFRAHGDEIQELYDVLHSHLGALLDLAVRRMEQVCHSRDVELMALTVEEYKPAAALAASPAAGERAAMMAAFASAYHELELSFTRAAVGVRNELRELLGCEDIGFLRARLAVTPASDVYLSELSALESRVTMLVEQGRTELAQLMASDDAPRIRTAIRRYEGEELHLSQEIALLRARLAALDAGRPFFLSRSQRHNRLQQQRRQPAATDVAGAPPPGTGKTSAAARVGVRAQGGDHRGIERAILQDRSRRFDATATGPPIAAASSEEQLRRLEQQLPPPSGSLGQAPPPPPGASPRGYSEADVEQTMAALCSHPFDDSSHYRRVATRELGKCYEGLLAAAAAATGGPPGMAATQQQQLRCIVCSKRLPPGAVPAHVTSCCDSMVQFLWRKRGHH